MSIPSDIYGKNGAKFEKLLLFRVYLFFIFKFRNTGRFKMGSFLWKGYRRVPKNSKNSFWKIGQKVANWLEMCGLLGFKTQSVSLIFVNNLDCQCRSPAWHRGQIYRASRHSLWIWICHWKHGSVWYEWSRLCSEPRRRRIWYQLWRQVRNTQKNFFKEQFRVNYT